MIIIEVNTDNIIATTFSFTLFNIFVRVSLIGPDI
jgi:hypothetical protein